MADNTVLNAGSGGDTISTDELAGGEKVQRVKVQYGTDGNATDVSDTNPMPVDDAGGSLTVDDGGTSLTVDGTVTANLSATDNAVLDTIETNTDFGTVTGGGTETGALRVTLANNSTGVVSVDDGGGSLTVDGTVTANLSATDNAVLDTIETNTDFGTVTGNGTASGALRVTIASDSTGVDGTSTDDSAFTPGTGTGAVMFAFADETTPDSVDEGDVGAVRMTLARELKVQPNDFLTPNGDSMVDDTNDALQVNVVAGGGTGGTSETDDAAFTAGSGSGTPVMGFASSDTVNAGDVGVLAMDTSRRLLVSIEADNAGIGGGTQYTEDDAAPANPVGTAMMMERDDALGGLTPVEGDWTHPFANANGALWTAIDGTVTVDGSGVTQPVSGTVTANLSATDNAVLDTIETNTDFGTVTGGGTETGALRVTLANNSTGVVTVDDGGGTISIDDGGGIITVGGSIGGEVAHDAASSGNPLFMGARATNSIEGVTQVANADRTHLQADLNGVLLSRPHTTLEEIITERVSNTNGTSTAFTNFAAGGAGIHNYVTDITVTNTSSTDGYLDIRDGTAGSVIWTIPLPANGGATHSFTVPLKGAANTALAYDVSAALSTVYISVNGFQAQG